jgi:hypothetical protein
MNSAVSVMVRFGVGRMGSTVRARLQAVVALAPTARG